MAKFLSLLLAILIGLGAGAVYFIGLGIPGKRPQPGVVTQQSIPAPLIRQRADTQARGARGIGAGNRKQILFGDLHVHSTISIDAFMLSLPSQGGDGAHPVSDACDFARYCSALDFWSINDHALSITPEAWRETKDAIRACNAVAEDSASPDSVAFLGWEWTNVGDTPENHWGHKNVVLRDLDDDSIPARPISTSRPAGTQDDPSPWLLGLMPLQTGFRQETYDTIRYMRDATAPACETGVPVRDLPLDCIEQAHTPEELFAKLDDWGHAAIVIPHGSSWGFYTPPDSSWDKQLSAEQHDPDRQIMVEVYSGHGNSEEYRSWRDVIYDGEGNPVCPRPSDNYLPSCWRAGKIIYERCKMADESARECEARELAARQLYLEAGLAGFLTVPGATAEDWLDAGQCRDCFLPAFNYRPRNSVQYMMALGRPRNPEGENFRFGFMASSDNHTARPGTGYKEFARTEMTEARLATLKDSIMGNVPAGDVEPESEPVDLEKYSMQFFGLQETERQGSFFTTGGLIAAHSDGRDRNSIWEAWQRREIYGTSGPRILLWFDLLDGRRSHPMGSEVTLGGTPRFEVRALGSFEQKPGCPEYSTTALGPQRLHRLCRNECYNPSNTRRAIKRIEIVRIRPQINAGESIDKLIEDPWRVFHCKGDGNGCRVKFSDEGFDMVKRNTLYYARVIEASSKAINADNVRCETDAHGSCVKVNLCSSMDPNDDCLAPAEQRAWSSPIFVDYLASAGHRTPPPATPPAPKPAADSTAADSTVPADIQAEIDPLPETDAPQEIEPAARGGMF